MLRQLRNFVVKCENQIQNAVQYIFVKQMMKFHKVSEQWNQILKLLLNELPEEFLNIDSHVKKLYVEFSTYWGFWNSESWT